jgi:hypothetical protein
MREAILNQQHAAVFEQQRPLLAEFEQHINYQPMINHRGIAICHPISSNLLAKLAKEYFKMTKRRAKPVLL